MMDINSLVVVAKKGGRFFTGGIKQDKFIRYREVKKLSDLKHRDDYITLGSYLKSIFPKASKETLEVDEIKILAGLKVDRMYIRKMVKEVKSTAEEPILAGTEKADEKKFWEAYHPYCVDCVRSCKQSHMMLSVYCPSRATK